MLERYSLLCQDFLSVAEPFIDGIALDQLKRNYTHDIDSKRKLSRVKDLKAFIRLLEKRDIISYDNIEPLWYISKTFIGKPALEGKLHDYENWLQTTPLLPLYDMYQSDETSVLLPSTSECTSSMYDPSQSFIQNSANSNDIIQTSHCCSKQEKINSLSEKRKLLQQTVLLQIKDRLGRSWRDVARYLGIKECEIDGIQSKYPYDLKEQSYEALKIYISQSNAERWAINLILALEKGRRRDLKEVVEELVLRNENI